MLKSLLVNELAKLRKILVRFPGEADNKGGSYNYIGNFLPEP